MHKYSKGNTKGRQQGAREQHKQRRSRTASVRTGSQEVMKNTLMTEIRLISLEAWVHFFVLDFMEEAEGVVTQGQITRWAGGRDGE